MKTRRAILEGQHTLSLQQAELSPGPDEVLVKTHLAGICGSDKNFYQGILPPRSSEEGMLTRELDYPIALGHEGGGTVLAVGARVREYKVGDWVMSFGWHGTFADYFVAPPHLLEPAPPGLDPDLACLGEPVACAVHSGLHSGVQLGDRVAVFGLGFAGQIIAQVARRKGAARVVGVDPDAKKREMALRLAVDVAIDPSDGDPAAQIFDLTEGMGADVVVEAAGTEESINACTRCVAHNGILVFYSWVTRPVTLNISRWHDDSLQVRNTGLVHHTPQERTVWTRRALRPVAQGMLEIEPLVTHSFALADVGRAFETSLSEPGALKIVIRP